MNYDLTSPCGDCPLRSDKPFYLRRGRMVEILRSVIYRDARFTCHKTTHGNGYEEDDDPCETPMQPEQQCAGVLILLHRLGILNWNVQFRIAEMLGYLDAEKLNMDAPVYKSLLQAVRGTEKRDREFRAKKQPK